MKVFILLALLAPLLQGFQDLPGERFVLPASGTVLHSGPSPNHPGVLTLDGETVIRVGVPRGAYREVFVATGFPVYMHADYVEIVPENARARVTGHHVNMRLWPVIDEQNRVGHLSAESGLLDYLGAEGEWLRIQAPPSVPLFALAEDLQGDEPDFAREHWDLALAERTAHRVKAADAWRKTDADWQAREELDEELATLEAVDITTLKGAEVQARAVALQRLATSAASAEARIRAVAMQQALERHLVIEQRVQQRIQEMREQEAFNADGLAREARILGLGLRFTRHGESLTRRGRVLAHPAVDDSIIFSLKTEEGETFKLSAAHDVADLTTLVGKQVTVTGRRIELNAVKGPVMVIHRVLLVSN